MRTESEIKQAAGKLNEEHYAEIDIFDMGFRAGLKWVLNGEQVGNVADRPNACAQLADVLALRDVICEMEKHMPDESSALGELYKDLVCKYNKVGEHFS